MKKSDRKLLSATLDKALEPPAPKRRPALASHLGAYDDADEDASKATPPHPTSRGVTPPHPPQPVAPSKDFNKRANSLDRLALPAGIFPGSSKKLYDALYLRTRGAVAPQRTVRATKRELSEWSGIRNAKTIDSHLRYFSAIGLVISEWQRGQNDGALYEVLLPEETSGLFVARSHGVTPPDPTSPHVTPPNVGSPQNLGSPHYQKMVSPHLTETALDTTVSTNAKTSFKTKARSDDEATPFHDLIRLINEASMELTGKSSTPAERDRWREFAELIIAELKIAAARTGSVSSVPAFLTEHLRRRLWKKDKAQLERESREGEAPSESTSVMDASKCEACGGSGWHYPEGPERGVAKCRHEKLRAEP
jgi:hypothetical protein